MNYKKIGIFIFLFCSMVIPGVFANTTIYDWDHSEWMEYDVSIFVKTTKSEANIKKKRKDNRDVWYYKGTYIKLYTDASNNDNLPNLGGDLRVRPKNPYEVTGTHNVAFDRTFSLQQKEWWSWKTKTDKTLRFIPDAVPPVVRIDYSGMTTYAHNSPYLHTTGNNFYFNPAYPANLQILGTVPTDDGVGTTATSSTITGISKNEISSYKYYVLSAADEVGNVGYSDYFIIYRDADAPSLRVTTPSYTGSSSGDGFTFSVILNAHDYRSGIDSTSFTSVYSVKDAQNDRKYTVKNLNRDQVYTETFSVEDNVSHTTSVNYSIAMTKSAKISDSTQQDLYYKNGQLYYRGTLDFGSLARHASYGLSSVSMVLEGESGDINLGAVDLNRISGNKLAFDISLAGKSGILPHRIYRVRVVSNHKNGATETRYFFTDPVENRSIHSSFGEFNGISVPFTNAVVYSGSAVDAVNALPSVPRTIYGSESSWTLTSSSPLSDRDGDTVTWGEVIHDDYRYLSVTETYREDYLSGETVVTGSSALPRNVNYLIPEYRYKQDRVVNLGGVNIEFADASGELTSISNTPSVNVRLNILPDESQGSGLQSISFFETDYYMEDEDLLKAAWNSSENKAVYLGININTAWKNFTFKSVSSETPEEGEDVYLAVRVEDRVGNVGFIYPKRMTYDNNSPDVLNPSEGSIITVDNSEIVYGYSDNDLNKNRVSLSVVKTLFSERISSVSLKEGAPYQSVGWSDDSVSVDLKGDFSGNIPVDVDIVLTDSAGNSTTSSLVFYTPGRVSSDNISVENYHNRAFSAWSDTTGNYLTFTTAASSAYEYVNIYKMNPDETEGALIQGADTLLTSHGTYSYRFKSVNRSGFENNRVNTWFDREVTVGNNSPQLTVLDEHFVKQGDNIYLGPKSSVSYTTADRDGLDEHRVYFYISGNSAFDYSEPVSESLALSTVFTETANELRDAVSYSFILGVKDFWGSDAQMTSGSEITETRSFIYDNSAPVLLAEYEEKEMGFSYINGDIYLKVADEGVGLKEVTALAEGEGSPVSLNVVSLSQGEYTHRIDLIEGKYNLVVNASDLLENLTSIPLIDRPVFVDHTVPEVKQVSWGDNGNLQQEKNLLSSVNSNFVINWHDSVSVPAVVSWKIAVEGAVVASDEIDVRGKSTGLDDVNLGVSVTNNARNILENRDYTFIFSVKDSGGNSSEEYVLPFYVRYDLSPPLVEFKGWNVFHRAGVDYVNTQEIPAPEVVITDGVDGELSPVYRIHDQESTLLSELIPPAEGNYDLTVTGRDSSGHSSSVVLPFVYDITPPEGMGILFHEEKEGYYKGGQTVSLAFTGNGAETYYYKLIDQASKEVLTLNSPGADEGWIAVPASEAGHYGLVIPRAEAFDSHTVIMKLKAVDAANNSSVEIIPPEGNFYVDNTGEYITVSVKPWVGMNREISARWQYYPGKFNDDSVVNGYNYTLYRLRDGVVTPVNTGVTEEDFVELTISEEPLLSDKYYFEVNAIMSSSRETSWYASVPALIDRERPVITAVETDAYASGDNLRLTWISEDNRGVGSVKASLAWFRYSVDEKGEPVLEEFFSEAAELGDDPSGAVNLSRLFNTDNILTGDKVKVTLIVTDLAGNVSEKQSQIVLVDNTPPQEFSVMDQGDYINPSLNKLSFDWIWSADDRESPVVLTEYQLTENGVLFENGWETLPDPANKQIRFESEPDFQNGAALVLAVKKTNAAGLFRIGYSNGIVLDNTAGEIQNAEFTFRGENKDTVREYFTNRRDLTLWVSGYDEQSGVTDISAELGSFHNGIWVPFSESGINEVALDGKIDITLPDSLTDNERFRYKLIWFNGTNTASMPFYSRALVYNPHVPEITDMEGFYHNGEISLNWNSVLQVPFQEGSVRLMTVDGDPVNEGFLSENSGYYSFTTAADGSELADGEYYFELTLTDMANSSPVVKSNTFVKDTRSPVLTALDADAFVAETLSFTAIADEDLALYSFKLGTVEDDDAFSGKWYEGVTSGAQVSVDSFDLTQFENLKSIDQSLLLLTLRFADRYGNWSETETALIRVDLTPPSIPVVSKERQTEFFGALFTLEESVNFSSEALTEINWSSADDLSGISGYYWTVVRDREALITADEWSPLMAVETGSSWSVDLKGLALENGEKVFAVMKAVNGAGLSSPLSYSEEILVDTAGPDVNLETTGEAGNTYYEGRILSIYNGEGDMNLRVLSEASKLLFYEMRLQDPSGNEVYSTKDYIKGIHFSEAAPLLFKPEAGSYGNHTLYLDVYDPGMNTTSVELLIRYNEPPFSYAPEEIIFNPGRPLTPKGSQWFTDVDGVTGVEYRITHGETLLWEGREEGGVKPEILLYHKDRVSQESRYTLTIRAEDSLGAVLVTESEAVVLNTQEGPLYVDEYWMGEHIVTNSVSVPSGVTLTLADGGTVRVATGAINGYNQRITVEEGASLIHEGAAHYYSRDLYGVWDGLFIMGDADLSHITVEGARRGVTVSSSGDFSVNHSHFINNTIGLHILKSGVITVSDSEFTGSTHYGIKEDGEGTLTVNDSLFRENGFDYYDTLKTVLNYEGLNTLDNNSGNRGE